MATQSDLAVAAEQIAKAKRIVARQREVIARLQAQRRPIFEAEESLEVFLRTLDVFEQHERQLRNGGRMP
jgi:hypothetical protein